MVMTPDEQIRYIFDNTLLNSGDLTVTEDQVIEYVRKNGLPSGSHETPPSRADGLHLTEQNGYFVVYYQERDMQSPIGKFVDKEDAIECLTRQILYHIGLHLA